MLSTGPFLDLGLGLWTGTWTRACQYDSMYTESGQFGHLLQSKNDFNQQSILQREHSIYSTDYPITDQFSKGH